MRVKISVKGLLGAFALADSGAKTERIPALLTFEARCDCGGSLMIRTLGEFPAATVTTSAVVEAIVREEGVHSCDLNDARAAFGRLKKTAKRGTWVGLSSDDTLDGILAKADKSTVCIPKDRDSRVEDFADMTAAVVIPSNDIKAALKMSKGLRCGQDGSLIGHVVSFGHGIAAAMDERNAEILAVPSVPEDAPPIHVPRQALTLLARSSDPVHIADGYASAGTVRIMWRLLGNRAQADTMLDFLRRFADGKSATTSFDGSELRQALVSLSAFLSKGDVISLLPSECGVKILRYDVRDDADLTSADRAEVLVGTLWPLPHAITLSAARLKRILGDADGIDLSLDDDPDGLVVAHVHGDPVVHIMCQQPCPFEDVDTI